jgi:2-polyprenyl-6-methoxyphenol hydroxylase-like FAD-dependent oxidoreductase
MKPSTKSVEVLVAGGGMAGIFAALGASQNDLTVALIEPSNILGGQGTAGGVAGFCGDTNLVNHPFSKRVGTLLLHDEFSPRQANYTANQKPSALKAELMKRHFSSRSIAQWIGKPNLN